MAEIMQATDMDLGAVRSLFSEYLHWTDALLEQLYGVHFDTDAGVEHDMATIDRFYPPAGRLLLAKDGAEVVGCTCMQTIAPHSAEIKRVYVRPTWRNRGIGRALLSALLADLTTAGYQTVRLESPRFMQEAHRLYRASGFQECAPFAGSEIPPEHHDSALFMARALVP